MLLIHRGTDFIPTPKEIYDSHEVQLEKNLEQPNLDSFFRLGILIPKSAILAQFPQANLRSN